MVKFESPLLLKQTTRDELGMGWLSSIRHIHTLSAFGSKWHTHEDIQLMFSLKGEFEYEFKNAPTVTLAAKQFLVIPPNVEHRHANAIDPTGLRLEMRISPKRLRAPRFGLFSSKTGKDLIDRLTGFRGSAHVCTPRLSVLISELNAIVSRCENGLSSIDLVAVRSLSTLVLLKCLDSREAASPDDEHSVIDNATAWLEEHLCENIGIDDLTKHIGFSRTWLQTLFKRQTGLSPADWIIRRRIQKAMRLLNGGGDRIIDIARSCGFQSPQYFNAVFKRHTGFTPSGWRSHSPKQ